MFAEMHGFAVPAGMSKDDVIAADAQAARLARQCPQLVLWVCLYDDATHRTSAFLVWRSEAASQSTQAEQLKAGIAQFFGQRPQRSCWQVLMVVHPGLERLVTDMIRATEAADASRADKPAPRKRAVRKRPTPLS